MQNAGTYLTLILALPLAGFLLQALLGGTVVRALGANKGRTVMGWAAFAVVFVPFLLAVRLTVALAGQEEGTRTVVHTIFEWIQLQSLSVPFELRADALSMTMTLIVTGIGALIHMYAIKYMFEDKDFPRFFTYLNLFIAFMLLLVLGNNLAMLFIGWEGVGLCSYLLIGYWYKDLANAKAANKAFITNRVGDWGLTLGVFLLAVLAAMALPASDGRWLSYDVLLPNMLDVVGDHPALAFFAALFLFIGAMGKSAQFPLYVWLPDAMAGPTPVSALIHAATMVTAGVFLLNRMAPLFDMVPGAQAVVIVVGVATALLGALIAFGQTDIKKVLAFSTVSQLGYMFIGCGVGAYWAGLFHVVTHAFFKALLFLGAGAVIYAMAHNQDMRNYGNLKKYIPITFWTMFFGWAAIAGVPFLFSGAYSKEAILGSAVNVHDDGVNELVAMVAPWAGWIGFGVAMLTAAYMTRMMMLTFAGGEERWRTAPAPATQHEEHVHAVHAHTHHDDPHGFFYTDEEAALMHEDHEHHHDLTPEHEPKEAPWEMWLPLVVLALGSMFVVGLLLGAPAEFAEPLGLTPHLLQHWLFPDVLEGAHAIGTWLLLGVGTLVATVGIAYGYLVYRNKLSEREGWDESKWNPFRRSAAKQFSIDSVLSDGSVKLGAVVGWLSAAFDRWVVDGLVNLAGIVTRAFAGTGKWLQTGYVRTYALVMQVGAAFVILYMVYLWLNAGVQP